MFPQQPQQQFRNTNADVQFFYRRGQQNGAWIKPPGVSQVYMMLIGGGGTATAGTGGGSGAVTTWWGSAQNVPDSLVIQVSPGNAQNTIVYYRGTNGLNELLRADAGTTTTGGAAMTANQFTASGFFQSVAGQNGESGGITASATTFLSGGAGTNSSVANYGYSLTTDAAGFFQLQPIIVGIGGASSISSGFSGGIGCGSSKNATGGPAGGPGLVIIAAW